MDLLWTCYENVNKIKVEQNLWLQFVVSPMNFNLH